MKGRTILTASVVVALITSAIAKDPGRPINTFANFAAPQAEATRRTLDIFFIDVEGGAATLIVTPAGESALIDAGWDEFDGRDAKRIQNAMRKAGVTAIDHLITTHYHRDHYGGVPELARLVPIKRFYDHGKMASLTEDPQFAERYGAYQAAAKGQTTSLKPGDSIPLKTADGAPPIELLCVASHAAVIGGENAGANPACAADATNEDPSDNARSVALLLKFGDFEFLNLADLSWNVSKRLVCPANRIGEVDLYQATHHGGNSNNDPALLRSLRPTVTVMINGPRKGGHPDTIKWLRDNPSFKALYQLHRNVQTTDAQNTSAEFIANQDEQPDAAHMITVSVDATKRAFNVTNGRTNESRSYQFKQKQIDFAELDKVVLEELKQRNTPGAAVAVIKDDQVIYAKGYGVASVETGAPVTPDMLFRLGSTTKMLTASALVTLADAGKLKLDAPIGDYVKGLNPRLSRVTAHQLLSQSAGLRDFAATITSNDDAALGNHARSWKEDVFFTEPGKIYSYSSPGYWLAGLVLEEVGGKPYADAMDEFLFKPLGMSRSTLRPSVAMTYPLTTGHRVENNKAVVIRPAFNNTAMWPGGSVYSNVGDLARFVIALMNDGKLEGRQAMSPMVVAKLPAPHVTLPGTTDVNYGYGLMSYNDRGVRVTQHGGASTGYGSTIQLVPEHKFAVIVLTNRSGETLPRARDKAMELLLPLKPREREEANSAPPLSEVEMAGYVGRYSHAPQTWEVFVKEGKLWLKHEGVESELKRVGPATFTYEPGGELVFALGADGKVEHLFLEMYAAKKVPGGK